MGQDTSAKNGRAAPTAAGKTLAEALSEAIAAHRAGRLPDAERIYQAILGIKPDHFQSLHMLGVVQLQMRDYAGARRLIEAALKLDNRSADAHSNHGNALSALGMHGQALASYDRAITLKRDHVNALANRGLALVRLGKYREALASCEAALAIAPRLAEALNTRAIALNHLGEPEKALASCDLAISVRPEFVEALSNRGVILNELQRPEEALASCDRAIAINPRYAEAHFNRATALQNLQRHDESLPAFEHALSIDPRLAESHPSSFVAGSILLARMHCCDWRTYRDSAARLVADVRASVASALPLGYLAVSDSAEDQLRCAQIWVREKFPKRTSLVGPSPDRPGERLRVAFVTWNMRDHPTMHLSLEFWEKIDRQRLEMFAYNLRPDDDNPFQQRARQAFEHFADVSRESVSAIAKRIREDRIAILIDRNGYTLNAREGIFPLRPAPIQVNCIGFPGTMGAPWYDYIFTDRYTVPEHLQRFYSERPLYMPHMAFPSDTTRLPAGPAPSREACGLPTEGFVFCCFNNAYKILPEVFAIWMRLLAQVPGSVLWLLETSAEAKANLRREAAAVGIDPARLIFAPRVQVSRHVARNAAADLFLDTYPYGAHTTANDALLAGLPVLTRVGETLASRIAGSQLQAVGLPELITQSAAGYEALGLKLATEPQLLRGYRERLAANRHSYPLFDMARYARDFEALMLEAWAAHA
jgi:predicted O-linked N-acetylglucosamine transferase (SPINDLY family)